MASFSIFLPFFKSVRFKLRWFSLVFDLGLVFQFYCLWFKSVEFGYDGFLLFFGFGAFFSVYCLWFKSVWGRLWWIFFVFLIWSYFFHFIAFGLSPSGLGYDGFFLFFDLGIVFSCYCLWFKSVVFSLWWIFFVFWFLASSSILLRLVLVRRAYAMMAIFFLIWGFFFHFIAFRLSPSGLRYDRFFLFFWFGASPSILMRLVQVRRV